MKPINSLPPFKRFCVTIGNLPSSYVDSMSYYECIMWLCKYLKDTVIPAVNENAEAVNELINWFNNLDVQDEIDKKLDEMAEDGTLAQIIEDYATIPELTNRVTALENEVEEITQKEKYLIIGDSYGAMSDDTWIDKIITLFGDSVDCEKIALGGLGFAHISSLGYNILTYMQHVEDSITDKDRVTKIIVGAGYNDYDEDYNSITTAITAFCNYCAETYPNAKIYIGCIGFNTALTTDGNLVRHNLEAFVLPAYSNSYLLSNTPSYIIGSEYILRNDNLIGSDYVHPTSLGHEYLAKKIYNFILSDIPITNNIPEKTTTLSYNSVDTYILYVKNNNRINIRSATPLTISSFPANTTWQSGGALSDELANNIGTFGFNDIYPPRRYLAKYDTTCAINCAEGNFRNIPCTIWLRYDRTLAVVLHKLNESGSGYQTFTNISYFSTNDILEFDLPTLLN